MTKALWHGEAAATAALLALLVSCAPALRRADVLFEAGDLAGAAPAYEAALSARPGARASARTLYRMGVARATPGTAAYDPAQARQAFGRLVKQYPGSAYAAKSALPLALLGLIQEASLQREALAREMKDREGALQARAAASEDEAKGLRDERDRAQAQIKQLKAKVAEQDQAIARLRKEMEMLKRIDLGPPR